MDFNAFEWIQTGLWQELQQQGFAEAQTLEEDGARSVMFATEEVAYGLRYAPGRKQFELRSATLNADGTPGDWRSLSTWLFDAQTDGRSDAESILNDFLEVVRGPKRVAVVQQKKKRTNKDDEREVDCLFFFNRLVGPFPDIKYALNDEKIMYGQVRSVTFTKQQVIPKVEQLMSFYPDSDPAKRLVELLDDMYKNGDLDLRSVVTYVLLNGLSDKAFEAVQERAGVDLQKAMKYSRQLKGKKIKPEKKKKEGKVESRLES